jgi:hypothetical protein
VPVNVAVAVPIATTAKVAMAILRNDVRIAVPPQNNLINQLRGMKLVP